MPNYTFWQSPGSQDFGTPANWTAGIPNAAGDVGVFDGRSQVSVKAGLNRGAVQFDLVTQPAYVGEIGGSGDPLIWNGTSLNGTIVRGTGKCFFRTSVVGEFVVDSENLVDALTLDGTLIGQVYNKKGGFVLASIGDFSSTGILVLAGPFAFATIQPKVVVVGPKYISVVAGRLTSYREPASNSRIDQSDGYIEWLGSLGGTTYIHQTRGTFVYAPPTPIIPAVIGAYLDGVFDLSRNIEEAVGGSIVIGPNGVVFPEILRPEFIPVYDLRKDYP